MRSLRAWDLAPLLVVLLLLTHRRYVRRTDVMCVVRRACTNDAPRRLQHWSADPEARGRDLRLGDDHWLPPHAGPSRGTRRGPRTESSLPRQRIRRQGRLGASDGRLALPMTAVLQQLATRWWSCSRSWMWRRMGTPRAGCSRPARNAHAVFGHGVQQTSHERRSRYVPAGKTTVRSPAANASRAL